MKEEKNMQQEQANKEESVSSPKDAITQLKEIGLKEVSNKTFITLENLTALLDKDFVKLNKTKALGFIQILEREYGVNLLTLKNEYLHYNHTHTSQSNHEKRPVKPLAESEINVDKIKKYAISFLALLALGLILFSLISKGESEGNITSMDLNVVKNDIVIEEAKESLIATDEAYEAEVNQSDEIDLNKVVEEMFKERDNDDINESTTVVNTDENENNASYTKTTLTIEQNATKPLFMEEKVDVERKNQIKETTPELKVDQESAKEGFYIDPIKKAWVGIIYLDLMKKEDFLIKKPLKLDADRDQVILVGHKDFKIFNKNAEQGFKSKKMVRFSYHDGELREISKQEYDRLIGNVKW